MRCSLSGQEVQYRHSDGYAVLNLLQDNGMFGICNIRGQFHAAIDGAWVHDDGDFG
jgi:hypothetical protein